MVSFSPRRQSRFLKTRRSSLVVCVTFIAFRCWLVSAADLGSLVERDEQAGVTIIRSVRYVNDRDDGLTKDAPKDAPISEEAAVDAIVESSTPIGVQAGVRRSAPREDVASLATSRWLADIYLPFVIADERPVNNGEPLPAILMIHGGAWMAGNKSHVTSHARYAAQRGYVVVAINYRLAPAFPYPAQLEDCRAAFAWMAKAAPQYRIDPERIAIYGYSAGAHLACLLGTCGNGELPGDDAGHAGRAGNNLPAIRAIVAGGAPCEFSWIPDDSQRLKFWLGGSPRERPELFRDVSPVTHASADDPPVFFFHGDRDRVVPLNSPHKMVESLSNAGVQTVMHVVPRAGHIEAFLDADARRLAIDFLDGVLRNSATGR